ncbi:cAMP-dependent protein kinase inhibitor gamma-like [Tachypleus tridentatus]|uniref:cAMP-dependent protein kinase inhibitor gamma-like n=1 Tax=Tachypleus tridentatus TaxID=6853 RepID=UPI003FD4927B
MDVNHDSSTGTEAKENSSFGAFLQTGRTGRRNAVPDIRSQESHAGVTLLTEDMQKMSCSDQPEGATGGIEQPSSSTLPSTKSSESSSKS